jgi:HlyD family secretion protein
MSLFEHVQIKRTVTMERSRFPYKRLGYVCLVICIAAGLLCGCGSQKSDQAINETWGRADAKEIDINSKVAGRVVQLLVKEGDSVKKGQVLAYIDKRDLTAQKEQAEANIKTLQAQLKQASVVTTLEDSTSRSTVSTAQAELEKAQSDLDLTQADYERFQALVASGAVSKQTFDTYRTKYEVAQSTYAQAEANVNKAQAGLLQTDVNIANEAAIQKKIEQAEATLKQIEVSLDETEIRAPYDGIITAKYIEEGSMISQGVPLVAVQDPTDNWVDFKIPETKLSSFKLNQSVDLVARDGTTHVTGTITDISKKSEFATQRATSERGDDSDIISFNVKVQVNSDSLRPGMRFRLLAGDKA